MIAKLFLCLFLLWVCRCCFIPESINKILAWLEGLTEPKSPPPWYEQGKHPPQSNKRHMELEQVSWMRNI